MGDDRRDPLPHLLGREPRRGPGIDRTATAARAGTEGRRVGVALHDADLRDVDADLVGNHLRHRRLEALAVTRGAHEHVDTAARR